MHQRELGEKEKALESNLNELTKLNKELIERKADVERSAELKTEISRLQEELAASGLKSEEQTRLLEQQKQILSEQGGETEQNLLKLTEEKSQLEGELQKYYSDYKKAMDKLNQLEGSENWAVFKVLLGNRKLPGICGVLATEFWLGVLFDSEMNLTQRDVQSRLQSILFGENKDTFENLVQKFQDSKNAQELKDAGKVLEIIESEQTEVLTCMDAIIQRYVSVALPVLAIRRIFKDSDESTRLGYLQQIQQPKSLIETLQGSFLDEINLEILNAKGKTTFDEKLKGYKEVVKRLSIQE